jgi:hypothetical protein
VVLWVDASVAKEHDASIFRGFCPEKGCSMLLRNGGIYPQVHMALQPRKPTSTLLLFSERELKFNGAFFALNPSVVCKSEVRGKILVLTTGDVST